MRGIVWLFAFVLGDGRNVTSARKRSQRLNGLFNWPDPAFITFFKKPIPNLDTKILQEILK